MHCFHESFKKEIWSFNMLAVTSAWWRLLLWFESTCYIHFSIRAYALQMLSLISAAMYCRKASAETGHLQDILTLLLDLSPASRQAAWPAIKVVRPSKQYIRWWTSYHIRWIFWNFVFFLLSWLEIMPAYFDTWCPRLLRPGRREGAISAWWFVLVPSRHMIMPPFRL